MQFQHIFEKKSIYYLIVKLLCSRDKESLPLSEGHIVLLKVHNWHVSPLVNFFFLPIYSHNPLFWKKRIPYSRHFKLRVEKLFKVMSHTTCFFSFSLDFDLLTGLAGAGVGASVVAGGGAVWSDAAVGPVSSVWVSEGGTDPAWDSVKQFI